MRAGVAGYAHIPLCLAPLSTSLQAEDPPLREGPHSSGGPAAAQAGEGARRDVPEPVRQADKGRGWVRCLWLSLSRSLLSSSLCLQCVCVCACVRAGDRGC